MIALMMVTDGRRSCFERTLEALDDHIGLDQFCATVVVDDGCDFGYTAFLENEHPWTMHLYPQGVNKRGFGGAIQAGWAAVTELARHQEIEYVFHLEDDFEIERPVDLQQLRAILRTDPALAQVALKRQPWSPQEKEAGGFVRMWPDAYQQCESKALGLQWYTHELFFTTNPSLYPMKIVDIGWPDGSGSEASFTQRCLDRGYHFGFIGEKFDEPWVTHIGDQRTGTGY